MVDTQQHSANRMALIENRTQAFIFALLIATFSVGTFILSCRAASQSSISDTENRKLSSLPTIHSVRRDLPGFANAFDRFWNDHFLDRVTLTRIRSIILYRVFSTSSSSAVAIGADNWLFWLTEPVMANDPFTPEQLKAWAQLLQNRSDLLKEQNIEFVFMPVPEKSTIYSEYLEPRIRVIEGASRLRQLIDYLQKNTTVKTINLTPIFGQEKISHQLYLRTDTHWTDYGALVAANQIFRILQKSFPAVTGIEPASLHPSEMIVSGDLAKMLGLYGVLTERIFQFNEKNIQAKTPEGKAMVSQTSELGSTVETALKTQNLPRAFVMRDSFTLALQPFLSERFSYAKYFWSEAMPVRMLLAAKPHVVIEETAERHLYDLGILDGMAFGTWPFHPVRQDVHILTSTENGAKTKYDQLAASSHSAPSSHDAASSNDAVFANKIALDGVSAVLTNDKLTGNKLTCRLDWRALSDQTPNQVLTLHVLDAENKTIAAADYPQNPSYLTFAAGDRWTDKVSIDWKSPRKPVRLGIAMYMTRQVFTRVQANNSDWQGFRAIFPLER
jgi:alginate O-acetyltransferase complex protein AlgJ